MKDPGLQDLLGDGIRYERGGLVARARECFEAVVRSADAHADPDSSAEAWWHLANLHRLQSSWNDALGAAQRSAELAREHGLHDVEANALNIEGAVWWTRGDFEQARTVFDGALGVARSEGTRAKVLQNLGSLTAEQGEFDEAQRLFSESRESYRAAGDQRGEAVSLLNMGRLEMERGMLDSARETLEAAVRGAKTAGDLEMLAAGLLNLGMVLGALGRIADAEERITTAYGQFTIADIPAQRVQCLMQLATLSLARNEREGARVCLTHARTVAEAAGLPRELRLIDDHLSGIALALSERR